MQKDPCLEWVQLWIPTTPSVRLIFSPIGEQLYLTKEDQLWFIKSGDAFSPSNWVKVSSVGLPPGVGLVPMALFNGQIYATVYPINPPGSTPGISTYGTFSIWRSRDIGKPVMQWTQVVSDGFNNPDNHGLAYMPVFNNKLIAVTTRTYDPSFSFGDYKHYGRGIQVWESASGDPESWTQMNEDGFGTMATETDTKTNTIYTFLKNQVAGGYAVYNGYLYIGTMVHYGGADVWRYDGTGLNGWTKVTPAGPGPSIGCNDPNGCNSLSPGRAQSLIVFDNYLYLAEGYRYPSSTMERYDGNSWISIVNAEDFDKTDTDFSSIATLDNKLYVATASHFVTNKRGDQVWGYPFSPGDLPDFCPPPCMTICVGSCIKNCQNLPQIQKNLCIGRCIGRCDAICP